jgi:hypothetical protein
MLIKESFADVQTTANGKESSMSMPDSIYQGAKRNTN